MKPLILLALLIAAPAAIAAEVSMRWRDPPPCQNCDLIISWRIQKQQGDGSFRDVGLIDLGPTVRRYTHGPVDAGRHCYRLVGRTGGGDTFSPNVLCFDVARPRQEAPALEIQ